MMKKYIIILLSFGLIISCTDYDVAEYYTLEALPAYVAFNAPGENSTMDDIDVDEDAGTVTVNVEAPTGTLTNITITYEFTGDALLGTDYNDPNNGTIIMEVDPADTQSLDNVDIEIDILHDAGSTANKLLVVTLVSAVDAEGKVFAVGRGGTQLLKSANINILNID
jgi:hypothetical protein